MLKKLHLYIGTIGLIIFLLTGLYLKHFLHSMPADAPRLLLRSAHIYLFFASLTNVLLGLYYPLAEKSSWRVMLHHSMVLISPVLLTYSFIFESALNYRIERHVGAAGVLLIFIWFGIEMIGEVWAKIKNKKANH